MKYPSKNMRRIDKVQIKEHKVIATTTNLLTNAAKMKITKAMANSKLQMNNNNNKMNAINNQLIEKEQQDLAMRRHLAQMLEKDTCTPILHYVTSSNNNEQQQQQHQAAIKSLTQSLVQQQVNYIKETTKNTLMPNERLQVKVENSLAVATTKHTESATGTSSAENVDFQNMHDAHNQQQSLEPVTATTTTTTRITLATTTPQTSTTTTSLSSSSSSLLSRSVVENCGSIEGTLSTETVTTGAKFEVNSIEDFQTQNNRCSDVVVETRNNNQQQSEISVVNNNSNDKEIITTDKCSNNEIKTEEENSVIFNSGVKSEQEIDLPVPYRGQNNSVIITNYNYQQSKQQQQQQQEQEQHEKEIENNRNNIVYEQQEQLLQRYRQQQQQQQEHQEELQAKDRKDHQQSTTSTNTRGCDPNLNQATFQEQQQYLLDTYNNCIYDLSLHQHLQQQQQQQQQVDLNIQQQNITPYGLPLTQTLQFFDECKNNSNNNNTSSNSSNNNNNSSEETTTNTNMPGNLTLYTNYQHESHHHRHHLESSHGSITHTPTSIDEVIQDTLKDECLDDHAGGPLSYCTLTAVPDLSSLRGTYYQQQLAHEQHLVQQHHMQHQHHLQPLLQQHLIASNQHHAHHMNVHNPTTPGSGVTDSPPPSALVHNNMSVDISGNNDMVNLNTFTHISNVSNTQPYGSLTPDHTPNMYFGTSLSPGLQCR